MIVADTNLVAYFLIPGERSVEADSVFRRDSEWVAPLLWRSEFRSVLAFHIRRSALSLDQALEIMTDAETLMRGREYSLPSEPIMRLVAGSACSAYDCEFVALARELGVSLVTSDAKVLGAFGETAISPAQFAG